MPSWMTRKPASVAIAFDLIVKETAKHHPKGVSAAYADIGAALTEYGFRMGTGQHLCL